MLGFTALLRRRCTYVCGAFRTTSHAISQNPAFAEASCLLTCRPGCAPPTSVNKPMLARLPCLLTWLLRTQRFHRSSLRSRLRTISWTRGALPSRSQGRHAINKSDRRGRRSVLPLAQMSSTSAPAPPMSCVAILVPNTIHVQGCFLRMTTNRLDASGAQTLPQHERRFAVQKADAVD